MVGPTGDLGHVVARFEVFEADSHRAVLFEGDVAEAELAILAFSAGENMAVSCQEAGVLETARDLSHLVIGIKVDSHRHRVTLVLRGRHAEADSATIGTTPPVDLSLDVQGDGVGTA